MTGPCAGAAATGGPAAAADDEEEEDDGDDDDDDPEARLDMEDDEEAEAAWKTAKVQELRRQIIVRRDVSQQAVDSDLAELEAQLRALQVLEAGTEPTGESEGCRGW